MRHHIRIPAPSHPMYCTQSRLQPHHRLFPDVPFSIHSHISCHTDFILQTKPNSTNQLKTVTWSHWFHYFLIFPPHSTKSNYQLHMHLSTRTATHSSNFLPPLSNYFILSLTSLSKLLHHPANNETWPVTHILLLVRPPPFSHITQTHFGVVTKYAWTLI